MESTKDYEERILKQITYSIRAFISDTDISNLNAGTLELRLERIGKELVLRLNHKIASEKMDMIEVRYPANWWEAFKEAHMPQWFLKKYPVKYYWVKHDVMAYYPRVAMPEEYHYMVVYKTEGVDQ